MRPFQVWCSRFLQVRREWPCFSYKTFSRETPPSPALQFITLTWPVPPRLHHGQSGWNTQRFIFIPWFAPLGFITGWHVYSRSFAHSEDSDRGVSLWHINYVCRTHDGPWLSAVFARHQRGGMASRCWESVCFIAWALFVRGFWPGPWWLFRCCPVCALSRCFHRVSLNTFWRSF